MRVTKIAVALGLFLVIGTGSWIYAQQQAKGLPKMLKADDYVEILQLYSYYTRFTDAGSPRDASWLYTEDGIWDSGRQHVGAKALKEEYSAVRLRHEKMRDRHYPSAPVIVPTAEGARGSLYMMTLQRKTKGGPVEVTGFGKYEDVLVKTSKGWRFKERHYRADTYDGDTTPVLPSPYAFIEE